MSPQESQKFPVTSVPEILEKRYGEEYRRADSVRFYGTLEEDFYKLLNGFSVEGLEKINVEDFFGCVTGGEGVLSLNKLVSLHQSASSNTGDLNINIGKLGTASYMANIRGRILKDFYERIGK